jgi:coenzyme F420-reducing hydrogenase alpha subunit
MASVIEVKPLTRVEGHGAVRVYMDGNHVERVELALVESPRLFEGLLLGKHFIEVPDIICRICSLCSTIHRVTALQAVEKALNVRVSEETDLYRRLIVLGGHIQSHALHLFCLALPDYFNANGFADLALQEPELLKMGLKIKAVGNDIQETIGGRLIHPVNVKIGGMGKRPRHNELLRLQSGLASILEDTVRTVDLFSSFAIPGPPLPPPVYMGVKEENVPALFGNNLHTSTGTFIKGQDYRIFLKESISNYSNGKFSMFGNEEVTVGALSRLNLGMPLTNRAGEKFAENKNIVNSGIWHNSLSQALELVFAVETAAEIVCSLLEAGQEPAPTVSVPPDQVEGTATTEAPRGVLIHSYRFDRQGYCTGADVVTPTAINQIAMERDLLVLARKMEGAGEAEMKRILEILVRAYDPCISCAVHVVRL